MLQPLDTVLGACKTLRKRPFASEIARFLFSNKKLSLSKANGYLSHNNLQVPIPLSIISNEVTVIKDKVLEWEAVGIKQKSKKRHQHCHDYTPVPSCSNIHGVQSVWYSLFPFLLCSCISAEIISIDSDSVTLVMTEAPFG